MKYILIKHVKAKLGLVSLFLCVLLSACSGSDGIGEYHRIKGQIFGTTYHVTYKDPANGVNKKIIERDIAQRLKQIDWVFSTYKPESEIMRVNNAPVGEAITVSQDFVDVLSLSQTVYKASGGAFDPSVGALVNAWGFGPKLSIDNFKQTPDAAVLADAKALMRFDAVQASMQEGKHLVTKFAPVSIDFSAVAKGYAVDEVFHLLDELYVNDMMVEIGGELATRGVNPKGAAWRIGVEAPENMQGKTFSVLSLARANVATSGDYRNYFEIDGKRYSHTIDPRTALPIDHQLASITVITDSVAKADAWATALMVLGEKQGAIVAKQNNLNTLMIYRDQKAGFAVKKSGEIDLYLQ